MRNTQPVRNLWYKAGKNADELVGPFTRPQLESLAKRGLIFPETPVAEADANGAVKTWGRARDCSAVAQIFYATGALLLEPRKQEPKPLVETAPKVLSDVEATRHTIVTLRQIGVDYVARCLSEILEVYAHFDANRKSMVCLGEFCELCPSLRVKNGYLDALMHSKTHEGDHFFRAALILPAGAVRQLAGETLRGRLYRFRRVQGNETIVDLVDRTCPYELDDPAEMRHVVIRRYGLWPEWPAQPAARAAGDPSILAFRRRQA